MTDLQMVEFNLLKLFVDICNKWNLRFYLVCGSALGAVKYDGFIPWDDDIDVALPRDDYEKFLRMAPELLPAWAFLQNYHSEPVFPPIYSKLRDSRTTYIERTAESLNINHGVFIDIFPLDGYPLAKHDQYSLEKKKRFFQFLLFSVYSYKRSFVGGIACHMIRIFGLNKSVSIASTYEKQIATWSTESHAVWCNHGNWQGKLDYAPKTQYGNGLPSTFEGLPVRIPEKYDEYLTQKYGNWRGDLPKEQQVGHHYYEVCDLNRPYTDYIEHMPNGKIRIVNPDTPKQ